MKINRNNYEEFFLDYHDGVLADGLKKELFLFLDNNPDLKAEFENFESMTIPSPQKTFVGKDQLKRNTITQYNYQPYFIAYIENDINPVEKNEVDLFIQENPSLKPEFEIFKRTKVFPDHNIVFENKKQLKHGGKIIVFHSPFYRVAIAASIVLFIITYVLFINKKEQVTVHREIPIQEINKNIPAQTGNTPEVVSNNKTENSRMFVKKNKSEKIILPGKQLNPFMTKHEIPAIDNKPGNPSLALKNDNENSTSKNENPFNKQNASFINPVVERNESVQKPFKPTEAELSTVFNDDDLMELGVKGVVLKNEKTNFWELASKGAKEISKVAGADISVNKQVDEIANTKSYAFAIGNFSISHTTNK